MKIWSIIFACLMFTVLFVAPVAQVLLQDDNAIVLQELEETDAEEGEDTQLKDLEEKVLHSNKQFNISLFVEQDIQVHLSELEYFSGAYQLGVETPPPKFS